jgi:hypothetical protein
VESWNKLGVPFKKIKAWTEPRTKQLNARLLDSFWKENWKAALKRMANCKFCMGGGNQGWVADIDWFLRPGSVAKLIEGRYESATSGDAVDQYDLIERMESAK